MIDMHEEIFELPDGDIFTAAAPFAGDEGTVLLLSGGNLDTARHHVLGVMPWLTMRTGGTGGVVRTHGTDAPFEGDPFPVLADLLRRYRLPPPAPELPLQGGVLGYLAYDLKDHLEHLPRTSVDDLHLPSMLFFAPSVLLIHDRATRTCRIRWTDHEARAEFESRLSGAVTAPPAPVREGGTVTAGVDRASYEQAVAEIIDLIAAGDVYQVNYTQRFQSPFTGEGFDLLRRLHDANPASFFAYVQGGDHQVVSTSPERFVLRRGRQVESRPIKGTRPRGETLERDEELRRELLASEKDAAELSMIVDLVRNDLGKVCRPGSVQVTEHKRLESYRNVHHLVSVVTGELEDGCDTVDLLRAAFPAGSITGCPKIRAMEIIDQLEPCRRHVYCGSIGYLGFDETADLSVAIRTATLAGGVINWSVGGGIVYDSEPDAEYEESLHKGRTLAEACGVAGRPGQAPVSRHEQHCWHNGRVVPRRQAMVPVDDLGLRRGYGLFETLRADHGQAPLLADHIARLERSWRHLMPSAPPDVTWADIINLVLDANGLLSRPALVRLVATRGTREQAPWDHGLTVTAEAYTHRLVQFGVEALSLATYPEPRQNPLAAHKTLSYIYYSSAGAWARRRGCHEALILNPDGTVSEGHSSGILMIRGRQVIRPESPAALPSVMAAAVCRQLESWGHEVVTAPVRLDDLVTADLVVATSGMMGAVPVGAVDGRTCSTDSDLWRRLNDAIIPGWDHELTFPD